MADIEHFIGGMKKVLLVVKDNPVLLQADNGKLSIASYNDYHSVIFSCPTGWANFKAVFSPEAAKELPQQADGASALEIEVASTNATLVADGIRSKFTTLDPGSLGLNRLLKKFSLDEPWITNGYDLKSAFSRVVHSANDKTIGDAVLRGYHLVRIGGHLELMASNGAVMTLCSIPVDGEGADRVLLLNPEFYTVASLLYDGDVTIGTGDDGALSLYCKDGETELTVISSLTSGKSFDYKTIIEGLQKSNNKVYKVEKDSLRDALKKLKFFMDDSVKSKIRVELTQDNIQLYSNNTKGASTVDVPTLRGDAESLTIHISGSNLSNYVNSIKTPELELFVSNDTTPLLLGNGESLEVIALFSPT